jgi:hypothetical protein
MKKEAIDILISKKSVGFVPGLGGVSLLMFTSFLEMENILCALL